MKMNIQELTEKMELDRPSVWHPRQGELIMVNGIILKQISVYYGDTYEEDNICLKPLEDQDDTYEEGNIYLIPLEGQDDTYYPLSVNFDVDIFSVKE